MLYLVFLALSLGLSFLHSFLFLLVWVYYFKQMSRLSQLLQRSYTRFSPIYHMHTKRISRPNDKNPTSNKFKTNSKTIHPEITRAQSFSLIRVRNFNSNAFDITFFFGSKAKHKNAYARRKSTKESFYNCWFICSISLFHSQFFFRCVCKNTIVCVFHLVLNFNWRAVIVFIHGNTKYIYVTHSFKMRTKH